MYMPRGEMKKIDIYSRVLKLKMGLSQGTYKPDWDSYAKLKANAVLNDILDIINEYSH